MNHEHRFQRLRDDALFCECGEIRYVPATVPIPGTSPTIYPVPAPWTPWPNTVPTWTWPDTTITYQPNTVTTDFPNAGRMKVYGTAEGAKA